ncbi:hypothetical protein ACOAOT_25015 [Lacrimispora sp. AGF001]|uniref:hypothetical protein n=1 Tax=Lacrimispora sp. AGF001 TaxID=3401631 RepID=UPI003B4307EE
MVKKILVKLLLWCLYTVIIGILPVGLILLVCMISNTNFSYGMICSGIYFFNLTIFADNFKELIQIKSFKDFNLVLLFTCIGGISISSFIYGILLYNDYIVNLSLNYSKIYYVSLIFTGASILIAIYAQAMRVIGGVKNV